MQDRMTDKEQAQEVKRLWKEYGQPVVVAVVIGLLISYGWQGWKKHQANVRYKAAAIYAELQSAKKNQNKSSVEAYAKTLKQDYKRTVYASLGQMVLAKEALGKGNYQAADQSLQWVIQRNQSPWLVVLAQFNLSQSLQAQGQYDQALGMLDKIPEAFKPLVLEEKSNIYLAQGKKHEAAEALEQAKNLFLAKKIDASWIDLRLSVLDED